jgi:Tfp pilus assembly protein PilF
MPPDGDHGEMNDPQGPDEAKIRAEVERRVQMASDALAAGRTAEAAQIYAALARAFPGNAMCHANLGICLRRLGRPDAALASFRRARALAPNDPTKHTSRGNVQRELGRLEE